MSTIHEVGRIVGIKPAETDKILQEVKENSAKIAACAKPHDFSICLDRHTKMPIQNPEPAQRFGAKWQCSKCGGTVDGLSRIWYNHGLRDAGFPVTEV